MPVELLYFAWVRERIGVSGERVELPDGIETVSEMIDWLALRGGGYASAFAERERLRTAVDQRFGSIDAPLAGAREIAIFPPVTGG